MFLGPELKKFSYFLGGGGLFVLFCFSLNKSFIIISGNNLGALNRLKVALFILGIFFLTLLIFVL